MPPSQCCSGDGFQIHMRKRVEKKRSTQQQQKKTQLENGTEKERMK